MSLTRLVERTCRQIEPVEQRPLRERVVSAHVGLVVVRQRRAVGRIDAILAGSIEHVP